MYVLGGPEADVPMSELTPEARLNPERRGQYEAGRLNSKMEQSQIPRA
jgi:hypothetical protein